MVRRSRRACSVRPLSGEMKVFQVVRDKTACNVRARDNNGKDRKSVVSTANVYARPSHSTVAGVRYALCRQGLVRGKCIHGVLSRAVPRSRPLLTLFFLIPDSRSPLFKTSKNTTRFISFRNLIRLNVRRREIFYMAATPESLYFINNSRRKQFHFKKNIL